jgi:hypothetical protein
VDGYQEVEKGSNQHRQHSSGMSLHSLLCRGVFRTASRSATKLLVWGALQAILCARRILSAANYEALSVFAHLQSGGNSSFAVSFSLQF